VLVATTGYGAVRTGIVYRKYTVRDSLGSNASDYTLKDKAKIIQSQVDVAVNLIDRDKLSTVVTLVLATTYNYWAMKQCGWATYVRKVVKSLVPDLATEAFKKELQTFCH
jgi:predicted proteasome-type protease